MFKVNNKDNRTMPMALTIKLTIKTVNQGQIQATQTFSLQYKDHWKYCPVIFRNLFFPNLKRLLQVLWEHFYDKFSKFFKSSIIWQKIYHVEIFNSINQPLSSIFHILHKCRFSLISAVFCVDRNIKVGHSTFYIILEINLFCILLAAFCI